MQLSFCE